MMSEKKGKSNSNHKKEKKPTGILTPSLLREIKRVYRLAHEAGIFLDDRELLRCDKCRLQEDIDVTGRLITYKSGDPVSDSGLRFEKHNKDTYVCPACGSTVREG